MPTRSRLAAGLALLGVLALAGCGTRDDGAGDSAAGDSAAGDSAAGDNAAGDSAAERTQAEAALARAEQTIAEQRRALAGAEVRVENLLAQKQALEERIDELSADLREAQAKGESRPSWTAGASPIPGEQPRATGEVLAVDEDTGVVVVSLGGEDGVKAGYRYTVSRGSRYVAMIEITDVEPGRSRAKAPPDLQKMPIQSGDRVMSR